MELAAILIYFGTMIAIYAILAQSLNFQYGFAGLINFGQVGFFAVGAYATGILTTGGYPIWLGFVAAALISALVGFLVSLPTQKLSVHYWAITTIAIGEIIRLIALNEEWLTRGSFGLLNIPQPLHGQVPGEYYPLFYMLFCWAFLAGILIVIRLLVNSPYGGVLKMIREDENLALSFGKPVFRFRVSAMTLGAGMAGIAGALYAHYVTYISPEDFMPLVTFVVWVMVIVGGRANQAGVIFGTILIVIFYNSTRFLKDVLPLDTQTLASLRMVAIGALIMVTIVKKPDGLIPEKKVMIR